MLPGFSRGERDCLPDGLPPLPVALASRLRSIFRSALPTPARFVTRHAPPSAGLDQYARALMDSTKMPKGRFTRPTTGFVALLLALHVCDEARLFGFGMSARTRTARSTSLRNSTRRGGLFSTCRGASAPRKTTSRTGCTTTTRSSSGSPPPRATTRARRSRAATCRSCTSRATRRQWWPLPR
mmetsp:Transcript_687/g.2122  ORF Transcript_687/g.2122 Transcript_687/m.2122 type:complete len:183 (+) Transcript_687:2-550(+)